MIIIFFFILCDIYKCRERSIEVESTLCFIKNITTEGSGIECEPWRWRCRIPARNRQVWRSAVFHHARVALGWLYESAPWPRTQYWEDVTDPAFSLAPGQPRTSQENPSWQGLSRSRWSGCLPRATRRASRDRERLVPQTYTPYRRHHYYSVRIIISARFTYHWSSWLATDTELGMKVRCVRRKSST
jgi:hypothetical protein